MNQKTFMLVLVGIVIAAAGLIYSNNMKSTEAAKKEAREASIKNSAPVEAIIWESMNQAILGSGSIN